MAEQLRFPFPKYQTFYRGRAMIQCHLNCPGPSRKIRGVTEQMEIECERLEKEDEGDLIDTVAGDLLPVPSRDERRRLWRKSTNTKVTETIRGKQNMKNGTPQSVDMFGRK